MNFNINYSFMPKAIVLYQNFYLFSKSSNINANRNFKILYLLRFYNIIGV